MKIPFSPNAITVTGFVANLAAAYALSFDLLLGGILILLSSLFDVMDGAVARAKGKATRFGAYLDSVLDRFSDAFQFIALSFYFAGREPVGSYLSLGALVGAFGVSYARARAEGLGVECKVGVMERPERLIVLSLGAMTGLIMPALWVLFIFTHFTVLQRMLHARKAMKAEGG
jgi:phosphatidylglycerophosphate synthase